MTNKYVKEPPQVQKIREKIQNSFNKLVFIEEGHKYYLGDEQLISVSVLTHKFKRPENEFDSVTRSVAYAETHGMTPEYWMDKWKEINDLANHEGHMAHSYGEAKFYERVGEKEKIKELCPSAYYKILNGRLYGYSNKEKAIDQFWEDLPSSFWPVFAETKVYTSEPSFKPNYAGTFDILFYYDGSEGGKDGLVIFDYKTNKSLKNQFKDQMLSEPFENYPDENLSFYTLQLSAYQIPLEDIGLNVLARKIIYLKEDKTYEKINVPDVTKLLRKTLEEGHLLLKKH